MTPESLLEALSELDEAIKSAGGSGLGTYVRKDKKSAYSSVPGWPDAPRHYCQVDHDDPGGLPWCCHTTKDCPVLSNKLEEFKISKDLYGEVKKRWAKKYEMYGSVCWGDESGSEGDYDLASIPNDHSLAYCCKKSKCRRRDSALNKRYLILDDYYLRKQELGEDFREIARRINKGESSEDILKELQEKPI